MWPIESITCAFSTSLSSIETPFDGAFTMTFDGATIRSMIEGGFSSLMAAAIDLAIGILTSPPDGIEGPDDETLIYLLLASTNSSFLKHSESILSSRIVESRSDNLEQKSLAVVSSIHPRGKF